ncbi:hypothetical protein LWM68_18320 [Niabella sp. W65]|nr:hypothetical protein [Niabella sp. W65]MCH7364534.1 hypothetical protein [Niabella sp. W65]
MEVLHDYINLEKLRYEERLELNMNIHIPETSFTIAPLLMLPLVENAFKHGAAETTDIPWINIDLNVRDHTMIFKISNSKPEQAVADNENADQKE